MYTKTQSGLVAFATALLAIIASLALAMPASAYWSPRSAGDDNDIRVSVSNSATVTNVVETEAKTGGNEATGGDGEEGGNGGEAEGTGDNTGGNGGNGGNGALGGLIDTGDAVALSSVTNTVNTVRTHITDSCGCEEDARPSFMDMFTRRTTAGDDNDIRVRLENSATIMNEVETEAMTGGNEADGGDGEEGGNGGEAEERDGRHTPRMMMPYYFSFWTPANDTNQGGNGGNGGNGGVGGEIYTGNTTSGSEVVNVVNRTVTRIVR